MLLDALFRFLGLYDSKGLRHSISHLQKIRYEILRYPLEKQKKYADEETVMLVDRNDPVITRDINDVKSIPTGWNATSVGNLAYIACHYHHSDTRLKAIELLSILEKKYT